MRIFEIDGSNVLPFRRKKKAYSHPKPMDIHPDAQAIISAGGLAASNESMERNIGRNFRFKDAGRKGDGLIHREVHKIVGVQKDYKGDLCYRAVPVDEEKWGAAGRFGSVAHPSRVEFIDGGEVIPLKVDEALNPQHTQPRLEWSYTSQNGVWLLRDRDTLKRFGGVKGVGKSRFLCVADGKQIEDAASLSQAKRKVEAKLNVTFCLDSSS